jgi:hypothetical protein
MLNFIHKLVPGEEGSQEEAGGRMEGGRVRLGKRVVGGGRGGKMEGIERRVPFVSCWSVQDKPPEARGLPKQESGIQSRGR